MRVTFLALMFAAMAFYDWSETPRWQMRAGRTRFGSAPAPSTRGEVTAAEDAFPPPPPPR